MQVTYLTIGGLAKCFEHVGVILICDQVKVWEVLHCGQTFVSRAC